MARLIVISDVHANLQALEAVQEAARDEDPGGFVVCGDLVGYGADPGPVLDRLFELPLRSMVAGNHDLAAVDRFPLEWFNEIAADALRWTVDQLPAHQLDALRGLEPSERGAEGLVVHGSVVEPASEYLMPDERRAATRSFDADGFERCFFGHTHLPTVFIRSPDGRVRGRAMGEGERLELEPGCRYLLNPGSVGQPRDGDPRAAYMVLDTDAASAEWRRAAYPVEEAQSRIRAAGLPRVLADRLALGR